VDHLFRTHDVQSDKKAFLDGLLARENMESWYLGEGLMMPHGRVEMGDEFAGVVGLSKKGFQWDAPDGRPIHAIVVLATPERQRDRHLEVLASFAQAISSERNIKEQLYHAHTAAHAYEILHADESEDFNYFLEDALERPDAKPAAPVAKPAPT
ncbi:MAG: PTS sugar transporter subunit IIA, partial [Myxococcota bacterium]